MSGRRTGSLCWKDVTSVEHNIQGWYFTSTRDMQPPTTSKPWNWQWQGTRSQLTVQYRSMKKCTANDPAGTFPEQHLLAATPLFSLTSSDETTDSAFWTSGRGSFRDDGSVEYRCGEKLAEVAVKVFAEGLTSRFQGASQG